MIRRKVPDWKLGDAAIYDSEDSLVALRVEIVELLGDIRNELTQMSERLERFADQHDLLDRLDALLAEFRRR